MRKNTLVRAPRHGRLDSLNVAPQGASAVAGAGLRTMTNDNVRHDGEGDHRRGQTSLGEGATLGLIVATSTWLWVAVVDAVAAEPFRTFTVLGGTAAFTIVHYLLNLIYGVVLVSSIRATAREPTLMMAIIFGFLMVEFAFAFLAAVFSTQGLGNLAWLRLFAGSLVGALIALAFLSRRHPLAARLREAK